MANKTDPVAMAVHGTDPQFLIEKILRAKIIDSQYWKEKCFGLTGEPGFARLIDALTLLCSQLS